MIKELMHDPILLAGKSEVATKEDLQVAKDLLDTLIEHRESCVGMAANMWYCGRGRHWTWPGRSTEDGYEQTGFFPAGIHSSGGSA